MDTIQGRALVASPYLTDPNFLRSVVYILQHDEEGAVGLVLNRPLQTNVGELLEQLTDFSVINHAPVYYGGPVDGPLMMLQECPGPEEGTRVMAVASDQDLITKVCSTEPEQLVGRYRVFDGYSGWGAQQLDEELKSGGWMVWQISPHELFSDPEELWQTAIKEIGREILSESIDPDRIPKDPAFN